MVGVPVVPALGVDGLTTSAVVAVEDAVWAVSEAERVHAASGTEASRSRQGSFVIEFKDRASGRASRLLILKGPQEGKCQRCKEYECWLFIDLQLLQGTVRQVDRRNGVFTIDINNNNTLTGTLGNNLSSNDLNRFNNLRSGDFVRFYGTYLNNSQVQLRQFN